MEILHPNAPQFATGVSPITKFDGTVPFIDPTRWGPDSALKDIYGGGLAFNTCPLLTFVRGVPDDSSGDSGRETA